MDTATQGAGGYPRRASGIIAAEIRAELARRNLSHRQLAIALGFTPMWIHRRIGGAAQTDLTFEDVEVIARFLDVPVAQLLTPWLDGDTHRYSLAGLPAVA